MGYSYDNHVFGGETMLEFGLGLTHPYQNRLVSEDYPPLINTYADHISFNVGLLTHPIDPNHGL
jgi:hypothetical protein